MSIIVIAMYWVPAMCQVPSRFIIYFTEVNKWYNGDSILGLFGFKSWSFLTMPNTSKFKKGNKQFTDKSYTGFSTRLRHRHIRFGLGCWLHSQVLLHLSLLESVCLAVYISLVNLFDIHNVYSFTTRNDALWFTLALVFTLRGRSCFITRIKIAG